MLFLLLREPGPGVDELTAASVHFTGGGRASALPDPSEKLLVSLEGAHAPASLGAVSVPQAMTTHVQEQPP